jgi:aspartyl-tRNA synthetase
MHPYRTHTCGALRASDAGSEARLSGWVFHKRDHGGVLFIDLRDHYGVTQIVIHPERSFFEQCQRWRAESVVTVTGRVTARTTETVNADLPTGAIELVVDEVAVQSAADPLPLYLAGEEEGPEETRLKYRFLDLRRERMQRNILLRSKIIASMRRRMTEKGFHEFQTPILTSSSPEGARDYLVPSRVHPGKFYALPQAPQLFKQLLMVSGFDRYFQIAPCFRDEDARADRSPGEFYQLDIEMAFRRRMKSLRTVEDVLYGIFTEFSDWEVDSAPFVRIPYKEAMLKYGSDKPDLRIPIEIRDVSDIFANSAFNAFRSVVEGGAWCGPCP